MGTDLRIHLIRHGQSEQNAKPDMIGQKADEPLSLLGSEQSVQLQKYFGVKNINFDHIFSSTYKRAMQTSEISCLGMNTPIQHAVELREYSAGNVSGQKRSDVTTPEVLQKLLHLDMSFKFPGGESLYEVEQRVMTWMYETIIVPGLTGEIAIFSHGMTIKCILHKIMNFDPNMTWRLCIGNTSISTIKFKNGMWYIENINSTPHFDQKIT